MSANTMCALGYRMIEAQQNRMRFEAMIPIMSYRDFVWSLKRSMEMRINVYRSWCCDNGIQAEINYDDLSDIKTMLGKTDNRDCGIILDAEKLHVLEQWEKDHVEELVAAIKIK